MEATIVSPILIIIVAITGIAACAIPDFSLSFHARISRFIYIIFGYIGGFLGIGTAICIHIFILANMKSFGVEYLSPYFSKANSLNKGMILSPIWKRQFRANFLNTKRKEKQDDISMKWKA